MVTAEKGRRCDFCGREFLSPGTTSRHRDIRGGFIHTSGGSYLPFKCPHCGGHFCVDHRLPENHNCAYIITLKLQKRKPWKNENRVPNSEEIRKIEKVDHTYEEARASSGFVRKKEEKEDKWSEEKFYNQVGLNGPQKWGEGHREEKKFEKDVRKRHSIKKVFVGSILVVFCVFICFTYVEFLNQKIKINNVIVEQKTVFSGDVVNAHVSISKSPSILGGLVSLLNNLVGYSEHLEVYVDGKIMLKEVVDIGFNESKVYIYPVIKKEPGMHTVSVSDLSDVFNVLWISRFEGYNVTITPSDPCAGENIEASIFLRNVGGIEYTQVMMCNIDGDTFKSENVSLKPGENKQVCFLVGWRDVGNYSFLFSWETGEKYLVVKVVEPVINAVTGKYNFWIDGVQHCCYLGLIKAPGGVEINSYGNFIVLINNNEAKNPTYSQLIAFLKSDKTDQYSYQYVNIVLGSYYGSAESHVDIGLVKEIIDGTKQLNLPRICADFAEMLHNNAERAGIRCAFISIGVGGSGHALNAFNTTDRGIVYIDDTGVSSGHGQSNCDKIVDTLKVGGSYIPRSLFPESGWSSTWGNMGTVTSIYMTWDGGWGN